MLGSGYVVDCCIAAVNAKREEMNYRIYMSDIAMMYINAHIKGEGMPRFYDIIHPKAEDKRTGREIADDILSRHGLKVVD